MFRACFSLILVEAERSVFVLLLSSFRSFFAILAYVRLLLNRIARAEQTVLFVHAAMFAVCVSANT